MKACARKLKHGLRWNGFHLVALAGGLSVLVYIGLKEAKAQPVSIPEASALYRHRVEQVVADVFGVNGSPARLAAQLHQESTWKAQARSPVGAQGMAQFMPATAHWMADTFADELGAFDPWNPIQAIHAAALYDRWLYQRVQPFGYTRLSACSRWVFTLRSYNGGETWLWRERGLTLANRQDPNDWRQVERWRSRGVNAHRENTAYPKRILLALEPAYIAAGWPGETVCR